MAKPQKINKPKEVIQPLIQVEGEPHILQSLFEGPQEELPELKSIGYGRLNNSNHGWVSYVITTKGKEVIKIEISEPDLKPIAEESSKINFVNCFVDQLL